MEESIEALYKRISGAYNEEALKRISAEIITAYKNKNSTVLYKYGARLGLEMKSSNKLFMRLIMHFHPDKQAVIRKELAEQLDRGDREALEGFARSIGLEGYVVDGNEQKDFAIDLFEEYRYEAEDFGYSEFDTGKEEAPFDDQEDFEEVDYGFIEAVKRYMYGNMDMQVLPKDFLYLHGELVLAGRNIDDLEGIEYCQNVTSLDLSHNEIENIYPLGELENLLHIDLSHNDIIHIDPLGVMDNLISLDLSFNGVEDADALLRLGALEYVNLMGNPLESGEVVRRLQERGVVVVV